MIGGREIERVFKGRKESSFITVMRQKVLKSQNENKFHWHLYNEAIICYGLAKKVKMQAQIIFFNGKSKPSIMDD